jgi:PIN domain nuclease of toxin-antitoxin system
MAIWALEENERLSPDVAAIVGDRSNFLCVSIAELAIKSSIGKLKYEWNNHKEIA